MWVAFLAGGSLYVADYRSDRVNRCGAATSVFLDTPVAARSGGLDGPTGLAFDNDGLLYLASINTNEVLRYSFRPQAHFTVSLTAPVAQTVTVDYATADGTATAPADYAATAGTITFLAGETEHIIIVPFIDDTIPEPDETFFVNLSNPTGGATLADSQGMAILMNDTHISISDGAAVEGSRAGKFIDTFVSADRGGTVRNTLTFGPDGDLYAATDPNSVSRYDGATGDLKQVLITAGSGGLTGPRDLVFTPDGKLLVASIYTDEVLRYDAATGQFIDVFASAASGGLDDPDGMSLGPDQNGDGVVDLYVGGYSSHNVLCYNGATGALLREFVAAGSGGLQRPFGLVFGPDGNLYVTSAGTREVLRYDGATGQFLGAFVPAGGGLSEPRDVAFGPDGNLYVTSGNTDEVLRYHGTTGALIDAYVAPGAGGLDDPRSLAFGPDDNLYVAAIGNNDEVLRFGAASQAVFTVTLSAPACVPVTVDFATTDGSAIAGSDYMPTSGTVTFAPGATRRTILVPTTDDLVPEEIETILINLSNPTGGATLADSQGTATIIDLEAPLFSDSFELGQWNGLWVEDSQNDWFTSTQRKTDGSYSAEVDGRATDATLSIATPIDLTPYGSAELTFDWLIESGIDTGEYLALDFFNGTGWQEVATLQGNIDQENTWHHRVLTIDGAYLVENFQFRFRAKMSGSDEDANVDNVRLVATSLAAPPNSVPIAAGDAYTMSEDGVLVVAAPGVLNNDNDADGDTLTVVWAAGPASGVLTLNLDGSFTYTPAANFNGSDSFTYTAFDGIAHSNTATVSITVDAVNDAPVAANDSGSTIIDTPITIAVLANDTDVDGDTLSVASLTQPGNGTAVINLDNTVTYTPATGYIGFDSFTYTVSDGNGGAATGTVTIEVSAPPTALDFPASTNEDTSIDLTLNGSDAETSELTFTIVSGPSQGTLSPLTDQPSASGTDTALVTYTPAPNYHGSDAFTYRVTDSAGLWDEATVSITVNSVNDAPVAADDTATTDVGMPVTVAVLANDTDVDGDSLSVSAVDPVSSHGGSVTNNAGGTVTYTPPAGFSGTDTFTYTASDGNGGSDTATVTITVAPASPTTLHVADLDGTSSSVNRKKWAATVTILVQDAAGSPVSGATVAGGWSHGISSTATTGANGLATVYSGNVDKTVGSVTFTVNNLVHTTLAYDPAANTDPDGDSNGTSIVVFQNGTTSAPMQLTAESTSSSSELASSEDLFAVLAADQAAREQGKVRAGKRNGELTDLALLEMELLN